MSDRNPAAAGDAAVIGRARSGADEQTKKTIFAGGSVIGALAMTSSCILPLVLLSLGATGAWIGNLASLYQYKWIFLLDTPCQDHLREGRGYGSGTAHGSSSCFPKIGGG